MNCSAIAATTKRIFRLTKLMARVCVSCVECEIIKAQRILVYSNRYQSNISNSTKDTQKKKSYIKLHLLLEEAWRSIEWNPC